MAFKPYITIAKGLIATGIVFIGQIAVDIVNSSTCSVLDITVKSLVVGIVTALINIAKNYKRK